MPKVSLEFNLPDEQAEFELAQDGSKYHSITWDIFDYLQRTIKSNPGDRTSQGLMDEVVRLMKLYRIDDGS